MKDVKKRRRTKVKTEKKTIYKRHEENKKFKWEEEKNSASLSHSLLQMTTENGIVYSRELSGVWVSSSLAASTSLHTFSTSSPLFSRDTLSSAQLFLLLAYSSRVLSLLRRLILCLALPLSPSWLLSFPYFLSWCKFSFCLFCSAWLSFWFLPFFSFCFIAFLSFIISFILRIIFSFLSTFA